MHASCDNDCVKFAAVALRHPPPVKKAAQKQPGARNEKSPHLESSFHIPWAALIAGTIGTVEPLMRACVPVCRCLSCAQAPKLRPAKSQFTTFQNASTNFGRALR